MIGYGGKASLSRRVLKSGQHMNSHGQVDNTQSVRVVWTSVHSQGTNLTKNIIWQTIIIVLFIFCKKIRRGGHFFPALDMTVSVPNRIIYSASNP